MAKGLESKFKSKNINNNYNYKSILQREHPRALAVQVALRLSEPGHAAASSRAIFKFEVQLVGKFLV